MMKYSSCLRSGEMRENIKVLRDCRISFDNDFTRVYKDKRQVMAIELTEKELKQIKEASSYEELCKVVGLC